MENLPSSYLSAQLGQGVVVMVLGMLVVFLFLTLLIGAVKLMSRVLRKFGKEEVKTKKATVSVVSPVASESDKIAAAIIVAMEKER